MDEYLSVGTILYHKHLLNVIKVVEVCEDKVKADTGSRGVLDFNFCCFGKVIFFEEAHEGKSFESYKKYLEFCDEEKKIKIVEEKKSEQEREARRLLQIKESEKQKQLELERQRLIDEEKKKYENKIREIREIIERRKIEYLVHFTRIDNLGSILQNGLIPVNIQQERNIHSVCNDKKRIDSKPDCTSCSVEFPNYKLFYTFREIKFPGTKWAIIILDKNILFSPSNISYYCHTNAAAVFPRVSREKDLCTANAFKNMFCESLKTKKNRSIRRASLQINDCMTTDPQAEILIRDVIDKKYIVLVCFQNQDEIDEYIKNNGQELLNKYDYQVVLDLFEVRKDYKFWK